MDSFNILVGEEDRTKALWYYEAGMMGSFARALASRTSAHSLLLCNDESNEMMAPDTKNTPRTLPWRCRRTTSKF
jgi:hypothetical protein